MVYNVTLLDLDITGTNPNNLITNEPHTLSASVVRSLAPNMGAFFADSLVVKEAGVLLAKGTDYQIVELHQEATLLYGKEIASVILIVNSNIGSNITVTYQALGGHYSYADSAITNMYNSVINDSRPVAWNNVFNKPIEFNPTNHRHLLEDVYGFEPVVDYLERIRSAITLGQTNVVLDIVNALLAKFKCGELPKVLSRPKILQYDALLYFLSKRKILSNIWIDKIECLWYKGNSTTIQVDTSGYPVGTILYWEFFNPNKPVGTLTNINGSIVSNGGIVEWQVYIPTLDNSVEYPLYLGIKESLSDIDYKAVTYLIDIVEHLKTSEYLPYLLGNSLNNTLNNIDVGNLVTTDEQRLYYELTN